MTKDHETDTDDLVERLENSRGWPNLGKAAAARIKELEAKNARLRGLADPLFDAAQQSHRDGERELSRLVADFCAALEEKNDEE